MANRRRFQISANYKANHADAIVPLVIAFATARIAVEAYGCIGRSLVENLRRHVPPNGIPQLWSILRRQPGANIIDTVEP